jgi:hypothetical protein
MLLSEYTRIRERIEYAVEALLDGLEKREGVEFREPKHDIASWVASYIGEFGDESKEHTD